MNRSFFALALLVPVAFSACETTGSSASSNAATRQAMVSAIAQEPPGDYYVGRRYYKTDYKFWGYIRKPRESWSTAKLVMLNENSQLAPDRAGGKLGTDNNYEYKIFGSFSGDSVYEPASNSFYPEFVFKGAELLTTTPGPIFRDAQATNPDRRVIPRPY